MSVPAPALKAVATFATFNFVIAQTGKDRVVAVAVLQAVIASSSKQVVAACISPHKIGA